MSRRSPSTTLVGPGRSRAGTSAPGPEFWRGFHRRYWARDAVVLRRALPRPLLTAAEALEGLVIAAERYRAGRRAAPVSFYIDHALVQADIGAHLPAPTDRSFAAYAERVSARIDGRRFGLIVEDLQGDDARLWLRLRELVRPLYTVTGWPGEKAKASIFVGNYRRTPFGVHRDRSAVFTFVLDGRKRILAWPPAFFEGQGDMTNRLGYERYRGQARVLEGEPGDIIYLPAGHWHTGEDAGGLAVTLTLTLFMEPRAASSLLAIAQQLVAPRVVAADRATAGALQPGHRTPTAAGIARTARHAAQALRDVCRDASLDRSLAAYWLDHATGAGFTAVPEPLPPRALPDGALLRGHPDYPILWLATGPAEVVCSANGHAFVLPRGGGLVRILRRINSGTPCRVRDLIAQHARAVGVRPGASARRVRSLLEQLWSLRAISVEGSA